MALTVTQTASGKGLVWLDDAQPALTFATPDAAFAYVRSVEAQVQRLLADIGERSAAR
jgi:hypothetical protein